MSGPNCHLCLGPLRRVFAARAGSVIKGAQLYLASLARRKPDRRGAELQQTAWRNSSCGCSPVILRLGGAFRHGSTLSKDPQLEELPPGWGANWPILGYPDEAGARRQLGPNRPRLMTWR